MALTERLLTSLRAKKCGAKSQMGRRAAEACAARLAAIDGAEMRAYHCEFCGHWHVGHVSPMLGRWLELRRREGRG